MSKLQSEAKYYGEITCLNHHNIVETLKKIATDNHCIFELEKNNQYEKKKISLQNYLFSFEGQLSNIYLVIDAYKDLQVKIDIDNFNQFNPETYHINTYNIQQIPNKLLIEIKAPLFSNINKLIEKIKNVSDVKFKIQEDGNKFFQWKKSYIIVTGEERELLKFKTIFLNSIKTKNHDINEKNKQNKM